MRFEEQMPNCPLTELHIGSSPTVRAVIVIGVAANGQINFVSVETTLRTDTRWKPASSQNLLTATMQLLNHRGPALVARSSSFAGNRPSSDGSISGLFAQLRISCANVAVEGRRNATVRSQGVYKQRSNKSIAKKMGAKRVGGRSIPCHDDRIVLRCGRGRGADASYLEFLDQYVIPGNIIYKQRGTVWHPGENAILGRDFTIHAAVAGYVKYYRDPNLHPTRQYIGVAFGRADTLPYPKQAPRHRRLAKLAAPRKASSTRPAYSESKIPTSVTLKRDAIRFISAVDLKTAEEAAAAENSDGAAYKVAGRATPSAPRPPRMSKAAAAPRELYLRDDYSYREANWQIGRLVGEPGTQIGGKRGFSRSAFFRTKRRKTIKKQQLVRDLAAKQKQVQAAARQQEAIRRAEHEARAVEELKKREAKFAELEAAESGQQLVSKEARP
jgi:ribosomal protein L27